MNIKRLFCVLFVTVILISMPCAYALNVDSDNDGINDEMDDIYLNNGLNSFMDSVALSTDSVEGNNTPEKEPTGNELYNRAKSHIAEAKADYEKFKDKLSPDQCAKIDKIFTDCNIYLRNMGKTGYTVSILGIGVIDTNLMAIYYIIHGFD